MNAEQQRILDTRPLARMRPFAAMLNWRGLQLERLIFTPDQIAKWDVPASGIITFYMTTDWKFNLQINELNAGSGFTHQGAVKPDRYGLRATDWIPFTLYEDDDALRREADRVRPWLDRRIYRNRESLRALKLAHPEMLVGSRKRRRGGKRLFQEGQRLR